MLDKLKTWWYGRKKILIVDVKDYDANDLSKLNFKHTYKKFRDLSPEDQDMARSAFKFK